MHLKFTPSNPRQFTQMVLVVGLCIGCVLIVYPFIAATLFSAVLVVSTWRPYSWLEKRCGGRRNLSALLFVLLLVVLVLLPFILLVANAAQGVDLAKSWIYSISQQGIHFNLPKVIGDLPYVGALIQSYWAKLPTNQQELLRYANLLTAPVSQFMLMMVRWAGQGVIQLCLVLFISFFLYRDGNRLAEMIRRIARKIGGPVGCRLVELSRNTISGVTIGLTGTAAGQALVASIGFIMVDAPAPLLLSLAVFMLSVVPVGPPLIWGSVAFWLYTQGQIGWAIFQVVWGLVAISGVDNFIKPMLISRSAQLPLLLIALGVFGGLFAFGFIGMFLGPTLLAVAYVLLNHWLSDKFT